MYKIHIISIILGLVIEALGSYDMTVYNNNYELKRPIKYYFHLLELKAGRNDRI